MLTDEQIYKNKLRYVELLSKLDIDLTSFISYLDCPRADFFNKPYNAFQDKAYAGSLCEHCLKVYDELTKLLSTYNYNNYLEADIIKVALLKDIYRAELYEPYTKNQKNEVTNQWEASVAYRTREVRPIFGDIGFSSYMIAKKFFNLDNDEVVEAICYSGNASTIDGHNIKTSYPLVTFTMMAELAAMYILEQHND